MKKSVFMSGISEKFYKIDSKKHTTFSSGTSRAKKGMSFLPIISSYIFGCYWNENFDSYLKKNILHLIKINEI